MRRGTTGENFAGVKVSAGAVFGEGSSGIVERSGVGMDWGIAFTGEGTNAGEVNALGRVAIACVDMARDRPVLEEDFAGVLELREIAEIDCEIESVVGGTKVSSLMLDLRLVAGIGILAEAGGPDDANFILMLLTIELVIELVEEPVAGDDVLLLGFSKFARILLFSNELVALESEVGCCGVETFAINACLMR